jgi:hypothetical protein
MNNMVYNAGLEALPPGVDWTLTNAVLLTGQVASGNGGTTGSHSGSCCAQLLANTSTPSNSATAKLQQGPSNAGIYSCFPGEIYTLNVWYRGGTGTDYWQFYINWFDTLGAAFNITSPNYGPQSGWTQPNGGFGYTFTIPAVSGSIAASSFNILVRAPGGTTNSFYFDDFTLTQAPATTGAIEIDANGNANIAAQGVQNAMIAAQAVQAQQMAANSITQANAAIAALAVTTANLVQSPQFGTQISTNIYHVVANSVQADSSVLGNLIVGNITIAMGLTAGGAIRFDNSAAGIIVAINDPVTGHAFVASNTTPGSGATTVLDGGYVDTFTSYYEGAYSLLNSVSAVIGEQVNWGGYNSFAFTLSDTIPVVESGFNYGTAQSIIQSIVNLFQSVLSITYQCPASIGVPSALNYGITFTAGILGAYATFSASAQPPAVAGGVYFSGSHFYFCVDGSHWVQTGP